MWRAYFSWWHLRWMHLKICSGRGNWDLANPLVDKEGERWSTDPCRNGLDSFTRFAAFQSSAAFALSHFHFKGAKLINVGGNSNSGIPKYQIEFSVEKSSSQQTTCLILKHFRKMSGRDKATNQLKDYQKKRGPGVSARGKGFKITLVKNWNTLYKI